MLLHRRGAVRGIVAPRMRYEGEVVECARLGPDARGDRGNIGRVGGGGTRAVPIADMRRAAGPERCCWVCGQSVVACWATEAARGERLRCAVFCTIMAGSSKLA